MSKKLEEEYLREIQSDIPNLWDRIDAGIDALEANKENQKETSNVVGINTEVKPDAVKKKKSKKGLIATISVLSAAAILLIVCAPVAILGIIFISSNGMKTASSDSAMMEANDGAVYYESANFDEEVCEDAEGEWSYDSADSESDYMYSMTENENKEALLGEYDMMAIQPNTSLGQGAAGVPREEEAEDSDYAPRGAYTRGDLIATDVMFKVDMISYIDDVYCLEVTVLSDFTPQAQFETDFESGQCMIVKSDDEKLWENIREQIVNSDSDIIFKADMYVDENGVNDYPLVYLKSE